MDYNLPEPHHVIAYFPVRVAGFSGPPHSSYFAEILRAAIRSGYAATGAELDLLKRLIRSSSP